MASKRKAVSFSFANVPGYQKKVHTKLVKCSTIIAPKEIDSTCKNSNYLKLECPREHCSKKAASVLIEKKKGHTNLRIHLAQCHGRQEELLGLINEVEELSESNAESTDFF